MPALLRSSSGVMRDAAAGLVATDAPETCSCCGGTCVICQAATTLEGVEVVCPPQRGKIVSFSGITLVPSRSDGGFYANAEDFEFTLSFDSGTLSATACLHAIQSAVGAAYGCVNTWTSSEPIATAMARREGTGPPRPIDFFAYVDFQCGGTVRCYITGSVFGIDLYLFSTELSSFSETNETPGVWDLSCSRSGITIDNAFTNDTAFLSAPDGPAAGYGGTASIGGPCTTGDCTACAPTSVVVTIDSTPEYEAAIPDVAYHESYVLAKVGGVPCVYTGTGVNNAGRPVTVTLQFVADQDYHGVGVLITDTSGPDPQGQSPGGIKRCNGTAGSLIGDYSTSTLIGTTAGDILPGYTITIS